MTPGLPLFVIDIGVDPVLVQLGPLAIRWYGIMYVVGIVAGLWVALPYAERHGISREQAYQVFWPVLVGALLGGRLYYVGQSDLGWYLLHPTKIPATWEGGMAFYGAVFLGVPVAFVVCRRSSISFPVVLDAAALFIPVAQAFGRIGNVINGDIVGYKSSLPWAVRYINQHNTFVRSHSEAFQPAAVYELLFSLVLFLFLWWLRGRLSVPGELFAAWLVIYSIGQFALFFARANPVLLLGLKQAQLTALVVIVVVGPATWIWRRRYLTRSLHHPPGRDRTAEATSF